MTVGCNHGVYDYIRTDDKDHPGIIIARDDEYVGIRTRWNRPLRDRDSAGIGQG